MQAITRRTALAAAAPAFLTGKTKRPNILFLCSDQHQTAASGCYGHPDAKTPHIDRLASEGVRFNGAYCQSPVCVPSRGSIITGDYPHKHGARILQDALSADARTAAHFFGERGYHTAAIGKMHFVDESRTHGFRKRINHASFQATLTAGEKQRIRDDQGGAGGTSGVRSSLPAHLFRDTYYADQTVDFLRQVDQPFCLWASFFMPHTPLVPFGEFWDLYDPDKLTLPSRATNALGTAFEGHLIRAKERGWYEQTDDQLRLALAGYYGNTSQMDANVGRVLQALDDRGLADNTIVVYTSDHGEMAGAHRMWTKHNMFEQSVSVPLVLRAPGRLPAGESRNGFVEQIDLFPTLAELAGFEAPTDIHGQSFLPFAEGQKLSAREFAYSEYDFCHRVFTADNRYVGKPPIRMVRTERWKLNYLSWARSELYDLEADPHEESNLINNPRYADVAKELTNLAERQAQT